MRRARLAPLGPPLTATSLASSPEDVARYVEIMGAGDVRAALWKAARAGDETLVRVLLSAAPSHAAVDDMLRWQNVAYHDYSAMHIACQKGHFAVVVALIDAGADIGAEARGATTPLHEAVFEKHELLALHLIKRGANPHATTAQGASPLDLAARKNFAHDLDFMHRAHLREEAEKEEIRRALAASILSNNITNVGILRCQKAVVKDERKRDDLLARIRELEDSVAQRDEAIADLRDELTAEQSRAADLESLVQEANARRRRAEHDLGDACFEMDGLREQVSEAERHLKQATHENAHLDKLIQTSVQAVRKKQRAKQQAAHARSPRSIRLRTLEARVKDAEHQAFLAHEARVEAERAARARELALRRAQLSLERSTPLIVRQMAEQLALQWTSAGLRRATRANFLRELESVK